MTEALHLGFWVAFGFGVSVRMESGKGSEGKVLFGISSIWRF